jgi:hypothetical protein
MKLNNRELHSLFVEKGITHLHHANTVATATTFIEQGGLLSRGDVEDMKLSQTYQASDEEDKQFDVWYDVFVDTADLHDWFGRQNIYGPVLFKFNIDLLLKDDLEVWVTKNNPMYWHSGLTDVDKYFQSVQELRNEWNTIERQKKMVTIRKPGKPILFENLEKIILDDPRVKIYGTHVLSAEMITGLARATVNIQSIRALFEYRSCSSCYCQSNYLNQVSTEQLARLFLPKEHEKYPD